MVSLNRCIDACAHIGNGTGHRTATIAAPLYLTIGPMRCEAMLHNTILVFVVVQRGVRKGRSGLYQISMTLCCIWRDKLVCWDRPSVYGGGVCSGRLG